MALRSLQSIFTLGLPDEHLGWVLLSVSKGAVHSACFSASDMAGLRPKAKTAEELENERVEAQDKPGVQNARAEEAAKRKADRFCFSLKFIHVVKAVHLSFR